jgi:hypothetical protein
MFFTKKFKKEAFMKKSLLCIMLLLLSIPLSAGILGLSAGITGGVENWKMDVEGAESQSLTSMGLTASFSPPIIPLGIRGQLEYAWKDVETPIGEVKLSDVFLMVGLEYYIAPPLSPASLYVGAGYEISTIGSEYAEYLTESPNSLTDNGFLLYGGLNMSLGLFAVFAETGYGIIFSDEANYTHIPLRGGIKVSI